MMRTWALVGSAVVLQSLLAFPAAAQRSPAGEYVNGEGERVTFDPHNHEVRWGRLGDGRYTSCIDGGADFCVEGETFKCSYQVSFVQDYSGFTLRLIGARAVSQCPSGAFFRRDR
jgi:hypothetical protein